MAKNRMRTVLLVMVVGIGLFFTALFGLWAYMAATPPLHPSAGEVPSAGKAVASPKFAAAVEQARQIARDGVAGQNLPGLSVAVGIGGEIVWAEGFGFADLENRVTVTPDTRFRIGTASQALTSAAVGLLLDQGRLNLDEKIQTYVPEFPEQPWPVTLRQLMAHVAGVKNDGGDEGALYGEQCGRPVEGLRAFSDSAVRFEPGTEFRTSNYGWILVSAAVEDAAGEPFMRFMRRQIFEPLGMDATRDDPGTGAVPNRASPYFPRFAADPRYGPDPSRPIHLSCYAGAAAFLSTPSDLVRFAMAVNSGKLLKPGTVRLLQTSQRTNGGAETGYGLGWDLESADVGGKPTPLVGHDGEVLGGMVASFMTFPDPGIVVAVTSNTSYAETYALAVKIAEAFSALPRDKS